MRRGRGHAAIRTCRHGHMCRLCWVARRCHFALRLTFSPSRRLAVTLDDADCRPERFSRHDHLREWVAYFDAQASAESRGSYFLYEANFISLMMPFGD